LQFFILNKYFFLPEIIEEIPTLFCVHPWRAHPTVKKSD